MKKCRRFQFITDTRFKGTKSKLKQMDNKLNKSGVKIVKQGELYELDWSKENGYPSKQWRKTYVVDKGKNDKTWNDVYSKVNKIMAVPYKTVNC